MQTEKRVNVPDLRDVLTFWEMKGEILQHLRDTQSVYDDSELTNFNVMHSYHNVTLINEIESIGKKEC